MWVTNLFYKCSNYTVLSFLYILLQLSVRNRKNYNMIYITNEALSGLVCIIVYQGEES